MIVNVSEYGSKGRGGAGAGRSFKGAFSYYLHDKREPGQSGPLNTSERVAWTETRNLETDDMRTAQRVMIATAENEQTLKREAGRRVGKRTEFPVYSYSLSWHPTKEPAPTREEMVRAADESLKTLNAEGRQAVIVCHTDRDHPHVHVIVNRVSDRDGMALAMGKDFDRLDKWAHGYEVSRGYIVTPDRDAKYQNREQNPDRAARRDYAEKARATAQERAHDRKSQVGHLKALGEAQSVRHKDQWRQLSEGNKAAREGIYRVHGDRIKDAIARHKAESKPIWQKHYREWRKDERAFRHREKSLGGVVRNAWETAKHQRDTGQLGDRSMIGATVRNVFSSEARERAFNEAHTLDRRELSGRLKGIIDREVKEIQAERKDQLHEQRQTFQTERSALKDRQQAERKDLSRAWNAIQLERGNDGRKPYLKERDGRENRPDREREPSSLFDKLDRQKDQQPARERGSFFDRMERLEREEREKPRGRERDMDRDR